MPMTKAGVCAAHAASSFISRPREIWPTEFLGSVLLLSLLVFQLTIGFLWRSRLVGEENIFLTSTPAVVAEFGVQKSSKHDTLVRFGDDVSSFEKICVL